MKGIVVTRMRTRATFFGLTVLALALSGCAAPATAYPPQQAPAATTAPVAPAAPATSAPAQAAGTLVKLARDEPFGTFLTDENGMTLYVYTKDDKNVSNCYDQCAVNWPVLFTAGAPKAGDGVAASMLGTTARKDGKLQVTYNGWPLYTWVKDAKAGDTSGQNVGGVWFLISPKGELIKTQGAASSAAPAVAAKTVKVSIKNFSFGAPLTVTEGTTVEWMNADSAAHTVTDAGGAFDSGNMEQGATFSFTFTKSGTYDYVCSYHAGMKGQVVVTK
jgi:predicted lipoprotein with Yx(FWY)xxD motif/plastocyanin